MFLKALKSSRDRFAIASLAAASISFVRGMEISGIPFNFWPTNFAYAAPKIQEADIYMHLMYFFTHIKECTYIYIHTVLQNNTVQSTIRYYHHSHIKMIHSHHNQVPTAAKENQQLMSMSGSWAQPPWGIKL